MAWGGGSKCELKGWAPIIHSCGPASYKTYCRPGPGWPAGNLGLNECSWEGDPLYPMRPSCRLLTATGLSH